MKKNLKLFFLPFFLSVTSFSGVQVETGGQKKPIQPQILASKREKSTIINVYQKGNSILYTGAVLAIGLAIWYFWSKKTSSPTKSARIVGRTQVSSRKEAEKELVTASIKHTFFGFVLFPETKLVFDPNVVPEVDLGFPLIKEKSIVNYSQLKHERLLPLFVQIF